MSEAGRGRKMDAIGRIVIPGKIRRQLRWTKDVELEFQVLDDNAVLLRQKQFSCTICKRQEADGGDIRPFALCCSLCSECRRGLMDQILSVK